MKTFRTLYTERHDPGILIVTMNRPEKLNALNEEMISEFHLVVDEIESGFPERYRTVILRGAGRGFCSGGDIESFKAVIGAEKNKIQKFITHFHLFAQRWYELPLPTIACLHGHAAGGGASLALLCDLRFAAPDTSIRFSFSKIGLIPDMGAHYLLPSLLGRAKALELMYLGHPVTADEALALGLVNQVLPQDEIEQRVMNMAIQLAKGPTEVYQTTKRLVQKESYRSFSHILAQEVHHQTNLFKSSAFQKAVSQFLN